MTKEEFLKKMQDYGIHLGMFQIVVDNYKPYSYILGIYKKDKTWIIYEVGERDQVSVLYQYHNESEAFDKFYQNILGRLDIEGYINRSINQDIIQMTKNNVYSSLKFQYYSKKQVDELWNTLSWELRILNEFKYYAKFGRFVPDADCYSVKGYSARDICKIMHVNAINAFTVLIDLEKDPDRYLPKIEIREKSND